MNYESITVSALNAYARKLIETDEVLSQVWIEGEISGMSLNEKSGHRYFSLRDNNASVKAVMFCEYAASLRFIPKDGMYVVACCKITLYERGGSFQLSVYDIIPKGTGGIQNQLEASKRRLESEGLFSTLRKRPLPERPRHIGVVTSADSAAVHDITSVIERRNPTIKITIFSVNVQGPLAVKSIIGALGLIDGDPTIDLAIIARGGGSREDLWYFNDEELARTAAGLRVPFISAVGHEIDYTLIDNVSDVRAATPSAAAEIAARDIFEEYRYARDSVMQLKDAVSDIHSMLEHDVNLKGQDLKNAHDSFLRGKLADIDKAETTCRVLDPMNVLMRGYARVKRDGQGINSAGQLKPGDNIDVVFRDGHASASVQNIEGK